MKVMYFQSLKAVFSWDHVKHRLFVNDAHQWFRAVVTAVWGPRAEPVIFHTGSAHSYRLSHNVTPRPAPKLCSSQVVVPWGRQLTVSPCSFIARRMMLPFSRRVALERASVYGFYYYYNVKHKFGGCGRINCCRDCCNVFWFWYCVSTCYNNGLD